MTLLAFLLLIILFLVSFIYLSNLNPQEVTVYYLPDQSFTASVVIVLIGCVLVGLIIGYLLHLYSAGSNLLRNWKRERLEKRSRNITTLYREGVVRLLSGDLKKARERLRKALDHEPDRVDVAIALASVHVQEGNFQEGVDLLLKAKTLEPRNLEVLFKLAATYEAMKREEDAAHIYDEVLAIDRENRKALRALRDLHIRNGRWSEALDHQSRLLKTAPEDRDEEGQLLLSLRYEVARLPLEAQRWDEAAAKLREIAREAPAFTPARVSLGDALRLQGRAEEASRTWQEGYRELARGIFLERLEELYMETEDPATLLAFYRSALQEKGDDLMLRLFFGKLCLRLEMVEDAVEQLSFIESSGADFPQLHLLLAEAHRRRDRIDESIREYKRALGVDRLLKVGYVCDACDESVPEWLSRCPACGAWGSFSLAGRPEIRATRALELREIHHGERAEWSRQ